MGSHFQVRLAPEERHPSHNLPQIVLVNRYLPGPNSEQSWVFSLTQARQIADAFLEAIDMIENGIPPTWDIKD